MRSAKMAEMRMVLHMITIRKKSPMMENLAFLHCSSVIASKFGFNWEKKLGIFNYVGFVWYRVIHEFQTKLLFKIELF